jgi:hypothetical protein
MAWVESFHDALVASNLRIGASASVTNATTTIVRKALSKRLAMIADCIGQWSQRQHEQYALCDLLDGISATLPLFDIAACQIARATASTTLKDAHHFEEGELFPLLEEMSPHIRPLLTTFRSHHERDRASANSIFDSLDSITMMDALALRELRLQAGAFSEALRRHVQFEEAICMALFASQRTGLKRALQ